MVRPVSLSEAAFKALRREKREGESDSDVVLRIIHEAHASRKDPLRFLEFRPRRGMSPEEHLRWVQEMRDADTRDAWEDR